ncbi:MAG: sigma-70 family RNA polymerase sigma factor [Burkholderiales bacterium]
MTPEQFSALLSKCALRDQRAFAALYRASAPKLFAVAMRITRRRDWAEEVLQESYVNIWHHAQAYDAQKSAPMTWMTAIVRNRALDWLRRPRESELGESQEQLLAAVPDDAPGPEELLRRSADAARIAHCLAQLSEEQQRSIRFAFFHGLSHGELATKLQRPLGTVKTWIRRGLERLRRCLEGMG